MNENNKESAAGHAHLPEEYDNESAKKESAVERNIQATVTDPPVYVPSAIPYSAPPPHPHRTVVYVVDRQELPFYYATDGPALPDDRSSAVCAIIGFIFSWIPIVGLITFIVNCDAPRGSQRRLWATCALTVSMLVILFNLIFWASY